MARSLTQEEFISRVRQVHGENTYDLSKAHYTRSENRVTVICPKHGPWTPIAGSLMQGHGCSKCAQEKAAEQHRHGAEKFIEKSKAKFGGRFGYSKLVYVNDRTPITLICPIHGEFTVHPCHHFEGDGGCKKCKADKQRKLICKHGIVDVYGDAGTQPYIIWRSMIVRCYDDAKHIKFPTYIGCSVCDEWLYYSNFKKWFNENYIEGYALDKDILVKGNKVYGPDTCCFVPQAINCLVKGSRGKSDGLPVGVHYDKRQRKYTTQKGQVGQRRCKYLGYFSTVEEAFAAYKTAKEAYIKEVATSYYNEGKITEKVYNALMNYQVEITD